MRYHHPRQVFIIKENKSRWDALIAALTAVPIIGSIGFVIAYLHEFGYISVFGLPIELIKLDSTTILEFVSLTLLLFFLFGLTAIVLALINNIKKSGFWTFLSYANFLITPLFLYASMRGYLSVYVSLGLIILQMILIIPLNKYTKEQDQNFTEKIRAFFKNWQFWVISGIFMVCVLAYISGFTDGRLQREYFVPSTNANSVVLRIYGDEAICAPATDSVITKGSFFIIKLNEPNMEFSFREFSSIPIIIHK